MSARRRNGTRRRAREGDELARRQIAALRAIANLQDARAADTRSVRMGNPRPRHGRA